MPGTLLYTCNLHFQKNASQKQQSAPLTVPLLASPYWPGHPRMAALEWVIGVANPCKIS